MLMKLMRVCVALLTVIVTAAFGYVYVTSKIKTDKTIPEIHVDSGILEVSVEDGEAALLKGVTAYDGKDGDLTDSVLVESISRFSDIGYCKVTYAVCDADNHVVNATRQIYYTDYTPPKFTMNKSLVFSVYDSIVTNGIIGATDCLDGDISQNVIIYSPDYTEGQEGNFSVQATVTNSKGDSSEIILPMAVVRLPKNAPHIVLDQYLIYLKKGEEKPDWEDYIVETVNSRGVEADLDIEINTDFKPNKKGMYTVNFYGTDESGSTGYTALIVIVED